MADKRLLRRFLRRTAAALTAAVMLTAVLVGGVSAAGKYPAATDRFFVNDFAGIMTQEDAQAVYEAGVRLYQATRAQVVLVTVRDLGGMPLEDYSIGLARQWGIGDADKNSGILLLFTTDGPHTRIEVGSGLEGALPDSKAGRILDGYIVPRYTLAEEWSVGLADTYRALVNVVYEEYGMEENSEPLEEPIEEEGSLSDALTMLIFLILIYLYFRRVMRGGSFGVPIFIGGGGGFSGGGFSGGGGGFSGGGGGFSGGGASR